MTSSRLFQQRRILVFSAGAVAFILATGVLQSAEPALPGGDSEVTPAADTAGIEFFERRIRPLLVHRCYECHSAAAKILQGGLRVDRGTALRRGGDSGPAVVAGHPDDSLLVQSIRYDGYEMPPDGKLPAGEIALIEEWVRRGAPMPVDVEDEAASAVNDIESGRSHWSFQPLRDSRPPGVRLEDWPIRPLDRYVLAEMEQAGLKPSPNADRRVWLRRVSFDLTGLPPSFEDVERFLDDSSPEAETRAVDRLLASPHYGERWGRHWLDLARYTDVQPSWLSSTAKAWLYRDWVVQSLNRDLPYDEFIRHQLAADLVPGTVPADIAALGFLGLSPVYWKELKLDKEVIKGTVAEEWEERVDAIGRTFLGLTVACARCHDHKFDPISTADYYGLAGVLANTRLIDRPVIPPSEFAAVQNAREQVAALQNEIKSLEAAKPAAPDKDRQIAERRDRIATLAAMPRYDDALAFAVDDAALHVEADGPNATKLVYKSDEAIDLHVQIRGNPSNPGPLVPRQFLTVFKNPPRSLGEGSGRLALADALVTDAAPLTARVIVNRVWQQHFGRGLVDTPSDFGTQGAFPSHPDLLDYLAGRFIEQDWSLKWLHREIVLSATYRQSSLQTTNESAAAHTRDVDPENRLLSRMNRRRLDVEMWRDSMLVASEVLDSRIGGAPLELAAVTNTRRTLYGKVDRYDLDDVLRLHDFPDPLGHSPRRVPTTTPLQALFVMNSEFLHHQSSQLARRISENPGDQAESRIRRLYQFLFARQPDAEELRLGMAFMTTPSESAATESDRWQQYAQAILGTNEFLFID